MRHDDINIESMKYEDIMGIKKRMEEIKPLIEQGRELCRDANRVINKKVAECLDETERRIYYKELARLNGCKGQNCLYCVKDCKQKDGIM